MEEISATEAAQMLRDQPEQTILLDVREAMELEMAAVAGALHIPMGEIPGRLGELDASKTIICLCRSGGRSAQVAEFLLAQGYAKAVNLTGGIHAWSDQVDSNIPKY
jgi:rhodanese-related sulfurtransferase